MIKYLKEWFDRQFSDPQRVILVLLLSGLFVLLLMMGRLLAPVLIAVVIAYLLDGLVTVFQRFRLPHLLSVILVFSIFLVSFIVVVGTVVPAAFGQTRELLDQREIWQEKITEGVLDLSERYPAFFPFERAEQFNEDINDTLNDWGRRAVAWMTSSIQASLVLLVYLILIPLMVFFFLKDKRQILQWLGGFLPENRQLANEVWEESNRQIANYIRGKFWEIIIVGAVTGVTFYFFGLEYAFLLGVATGLSVIIPYVGATLVTIPIALVAYFQFGWTGEFAAIMACYLVIQALDANLLVPILFSKVVNLHPVAIIIAILFFGAIWGFWGVFFAIPLATTVKATLVAWKKVETKPDV